MFRDQSRLRAEITYLETTEAHHVALDAAHYFAAARSAHRIVERELGGLPMHEFAFPKLPVLQTVAENIYFESYGCFADLDGSGQAGVALEVGDALLARLRRQRSLVR